ncbi:hypothetical protein L1887_33837 [Cichorium endivia]|nr:hypothetical protein L1887_33837 [Cichorium endivia]
MNGRHVLPALAQVAERKEKFLVELFNKKIGKQNAGKAYSAKDIDLGEPFFTSILEAWPTLVAINLVAAVGAATVVGSLWISVTNRYLHS